MNKLASRGRPSGPPLALGRVVVLTVVVLTVTILTLETVPSRFTSNQRMRRPVAVPAVRQGLRSRGQTDGSRDLIGNPTVDDGENSENRSSFHDIEAQSKLDKASQENMSTLPREKLPLPSPSPLTSLPPAVTSPREQYGSPDGGEGQIDPNEARVGYGLERAAMHMKFQAMIKYIAVRQNARACDRVGVTRIQMGTGGGLGSKFQLFANKVATVLVKEPDHVFVPFGGFGFYTDFCNDKANSTVSQEWCCFFEPLAPLACDTVDAGSQLVGMDGRHGLADIIKAVQAHLDADKHGKVAPSRPSHDVPWLPSIDGFASTEQDKHMWYGAVQAYLWRPNRRFQRLVASFLAQVDADVKRIDIALHIRLGDKQADARSRQVGVDGSPAAYCGQAEVLIDRIVSERGLAEPVVVFVATDDQRGVDGVTKWQAQWRVAHPQGPRLVVAMQQTMTQKLNAGKVTLVSKVFQSFDGADNKKQKEAEMVWVDLALLVEARFLVGLVMSQFSRIAADIGLARGTMVEAIAIDDKNVGRGGETSIANVWRKRYAVAHPPA